MPEEIEGVCDERFADVGRAFAEGFEKGEELGAAVAVIHDGELVVDLWSGYADVAHTRPWRKDTMVVVSSTTKTVASLCGLMLLDRGLIELDAPIATYWPEFAAAGRCATSFVTRPAYRRSSRRSVCATCSTGNSA